MSFVENGSFLLWENRKIKKCNELEFEKWVKVLPRDAYTYLEYHFFDKDGNQIK